MRELSWGYSLDPSAWHAAQNLAHTIKRYKVFLVCRSLRVPKCVSHSFVVISVGTLEADNFKVFFLKSLDFHETKFF